MYKDKSIKSSSDHDSRLEYLLAVKSEILSDFSMCLVLNEEILKNQMYLKVFREKKKKLEDEINKEENKLLKSYKEDLKSKFENDLRNNFKEVYTLT